ncbi:MAG: twin-arginine translocase subunit TatC [Deltaproteobacteria bacterium]|nr:twin-arginine translocase subunit TatC [Deltaproteobacteria bacterium]
MNDPKQLPPPDGSPDDPALPLTAHLIELRRRLIVVFAALLVVFGFTLSFSAELMEFIKKPVLKYVDKLSFDTLSDPFFAQVTLAFYAALFLTFPVVIWQAWLFLRPALYKKERRAVWPFLLFSYPLFVGGGVFVYMVVFPFGFDYFMNFDPTLVPSLRIGDYMANTVQFMFMFGLVFELPLVALLLTRMGLITHTFLNRNRRYAIVIIFVVAAILTPPDVISQLLMAIPLLVLYEVSVVVSWLARTPPTETRLENK